MFRITEDPSSGSLVQCLAKNYSNGSIVSVDMDKVGVMAAYCDQLCVCVLHSTVLVCTAQYCACVYCTVLWRGTVCVLHSTVERHCVCIAQSSETLCVYCTV